MFVRNDKGEMVPFSAFADGKWAYGSPKLQRYNGVAAVELLGEPAPGRSSGEAMAAIEEIMKQMPPGVGYAWTGLSYEERLSGSQRRRSMRFRCWWCSCAWPRSTRAGRSRSR